MTKHIHRRAAAALIALLLATAVQAQQPFDSSAWDVHAAEWRVEPYRGRSALFLRDGAAWLEGSHFQNGTIEFDVVFSNVSGFPGIAFRAATHSDFELFYLRQALSDGPHATQYTPGRIAALARAAGKAERKEGCSRNERQSRHREDVNRTLSPISR
jgi:hypothetical protein